MQAVRMPEGWDSLHLRYLLRQRNLRKAKKEEAANPRGKRENRPFAPTSAATLVMNLNARKNFSGKVARMRFWKENAYSDVQLGSTVYGN
jgi:hypothetical protein